MHRYRVVERWEEKELCVLRCSRGQYHAVRALRVMPELNTLLQGYQPHLGFGLLTCCETNVVFRVIFETINDARLAPGLIWTATEPANSVWPTHLELWNKG